MLCACRVLSPYLRGGGAKSLDFQSLSQDLIRTSMQIPFSVPPYMSLLARSTATLEGIALMGDPNYQLVSQVISILPLHSLFCLNLNIINNRIFLISAGCIHICVWT